MVRREVIDRVGGLDERFFMYFEEVDWCHRIKQAGWRIAYVPRAIVVHFSALACLFSVAAMDLFGTTPHPRLLSAWQVPVMLMGLGLCATVGQLLLTHAFATGSPAKVAVVGLTQIVFALGFDVLLFRHPLRPLSLLGMALVLAPTAWLMLRRR